MARNSGTSRVLRRLASGLACVVMLSMVGCGGEPGCEEDGIGRFPAEKAPCIDEWRWAKRLPGGEQQACRLGRAASGSVLRLGLLEQGASGPPVTAEVFVGDTRVASLASRGGQQWADYRVDVGSGPTASGPCRVVFHGPQNFWVGPCELIRPRDDHTNVLIFLIDALRLDRLGCYGYARNTSPNIDAFARDAVKFTHLTPQSSWTRPSVASLLTSTYPNVHGAQGRQDVRRENMPSLAAVLAAHGYETHGIITNGNVLPTWGLGREFFRYVDRCPRTPSGTPDADAVAAAIDTFRNAVGRPWFMYLHTLAPHEPYAPPDRFNVFDPQDYHPWPGERKAARRKMQALYDGEILYVDHLFGQLVEEMKRLGAYDNSIIAVIADHGEEFWDHGGVGHGKTLFEEQLRIPCLLKLPHNRHAGEVRNGIIEMVDLAPTFLELLGLPPEERFQGTSFVETLEGGQDDDERIGFASLVLDGKNMRTVKTQASKCIWDITYDSERWYDLTVDPCESALRHEPPEGAEELTAYVRRMNDVGQGLHLLIAGNAHTKHVVKGVIQAAGIEDYELFHSRRGITVRRLGDAVGFSIDFRLVKTSSMWMGRWRTHTKGRKLVTLRVGLPAAEPFRIGVFVDNGPVDAERVFAGADRRHIPLDDVDLQPTDLAALPYSFLPHTVPDEFGVYLWYVAGVNTISRDEMDTETREKLQALGYL